MHVSLISTRSAESPSLCVLFFIVGAIIGGLGGSLRTNKPAGWAGIAFIYIYGINLTYSFAPIGRVPHSEILNLSQPYTSSYSNNFNRGAARHSTDRKDESSEYSQRFMDPHGHPRSLTPLRQQTDRGTGNIWEESIYRMYGDIKTPEEPPPPPPASPKHEPQLSFEQPEEDDADDSLDEEVPWHPALSPNRNGPAIAGPPTIPDRSDRSRDVRPRPEVSRETSSPTA
ncbi:low-affinity glucose transporter HXT3 [Colletotrichum tabaci]|uniref:Low-affinity glucose transporter HXT3 n=1 Tax=Colletotrichum tabaci TaxID=1209068 RepID=A0AAV9TK83_9PEZI